VKNGARKTRNHATLREFAEALGVPLTTLSGWTKHPLWKWDRKAPWPAAAVPDVLRWAADTLEKGRPARDPDKITKTQELRDEKLRQEIRKLRANAEQAETALARERGALLDAADVEREWASIGVVVRNAIENLPSQVLPLALTHGMPQEASGRFQAQVEELVSGVLRHLSGDPGSEDDEAGEDAVLPEPVPAGAVEPERVG
jgi:phage terminase Nu1 subunit (DNA packaging protein)